MKKKNKAKQAEHFLKIHKTKNHQEKNKITKTMVCLPDSSQDSFLSKIFGYICRTLVIFCAVLGLIVFFGSSFNLLTENNLTLVLRSTFICVSLISLMCFNKYCMAVGALGFVIYGAVLFSNVNESIFSLILNSMKTVKNGIFSRLYDAGYLSYIKFSSPVDSETDPDFLAGFGLCIIMILLSVCFVLSLIRKTRLLPPLIFSLIILVPIFVFNISQGNYGTSLIIISFASVLTMNVFDKTYSKKIKRNDIIVLNNDDISKCQITEVSNDLQKTDKIKKRKENNNKLSCGAAGGFAGFFMLIISFLIVFIPMSSVDGAFETIPTFDRKMEIARQYVTAVLRGDDPILDLLEYQVNRDNFKPHSTDADQLSFENKQLFYVETQYATNIYMRNWLGVNYRNGAWEPANDNQVDIYRSLFGTQNATAESMLYSFINYMKPEAIKDKTYGYDTKYTSNSNIGYITMAVNVRRLQKLSSEVCMPSYHIPNYGILEYGTLNSHESLTYVDYFDGIYTGRNFKENDIKYSFITNIQTLRDSKRNTYLSNMIADYNLMSEAFYIHHNGQISNEKSLYTDYPELTVIENTNENIFKFIYTYSKNGETSERTFTHSGQNVNILQKTQQNKTYVISTSNGARLEFDLNSRGIIQNVRFSSSQDFENLFNKYYSELSYREQLDLLNYFSMYNNYLEFVYNTYNSKSESKIISSVSENILNSFKDKNPDMNLFTADQKNSSDKNTYSQRDALVRYTIDYIIETIGCKYTITPDTSSASDSLDGVENFLTQTKEGYCVQFASAAALILREFGIPTRYNEGYIVCDFKSNTRSDATGRYRAYVHDYEAHAWIEVWFDGIGWVQYETTPEYYSSMYGSKDPDISAPPYGSDSSGSDNTTTPPSSNETESINESIYENITQDESETVTSPSIFQNSFQTIKSTVITLILLLILLATVITVMRIRSRMKNAEHARKRTTDLIFSDEFANSISESDRRKIARSLSDSIYFMLSLYGLTPKTGEFKYDFAVRASIELIDIFGYPKGYVKPSVQNIKHGKSKKSTDYPQSNVDFNEIFDALSAEEFGNGMSIEQIHKIVLFDKKLRDASKKKLGFFKRFKLKYIKNLI